jgi:putative RNA 2'-phosphotransferase
MSSDELRLRASIACAASAASSDVVSFSEGLGREDDPLVRRLAFLLRHGGPARGLAIDAEGWADLSQVARRLGKIAGQRKATTADVLAALRGREGERFESARGRIRALYGHSIPGVIAARPAAPPTRLFHGTSSDAESIVRVDGLRPMGREHVHLSSDLGYAASIARSHGPRWLVLRVHAQTASAAGVTFLMTAGHVWLAGMIRPEFIDQLPVARG